MSESVGREAVRGEWDKKKVTEMRKGSGCAGPRRLLRCCGSGSGRAGQCVCGWAGGGGSGGEQWLYRLFSGCGAPSLASSPQEA